MAVLADLGGVQPSVYDGMSYRDARRLAAVLIDRRQDRDRQALTVAGEFMKVLVKVLR